MLPEALRPKLFTGSVDGPQGMDTAVPRGLSAESSRVFSGGCRWHHLGQAQSEPSWEG